VFGRKPVKGSYTDTGVRVMLDMVVAEGVVAGKPLKGIVGPLTVVTLFRLFTETLIKAVPIEPRLATV
jgi:hypothetical protein